MSVQCLRDPAFNSPGCVSRHGIAGCYDNPAFNLLETAIPLSAAATPVHIPTRNTRMSQLLSFPVLMTSGDLMEGRASWSYREDRSVSIEQKTE